MNFNKTKKGCSLPGSERKLWDTTGGIDRTTTAPALVCAYALWKLAEIQVPNSSDGASPLEVIAAHELLLTRIFCDVFLLCDVLFVELT